MNERKCNECGTVIPEGVVACPSCGCPIPVEEVKSCEKKQEKRKIPVVINWILDSGTCYHFYGYICQKGKH